MKRFLNVILIVLLFIPVLLSAKENDVNMYLFYGKECPHCHALLEFLEPYVESHSNIHLYKYEVWHNEENQVLFKDVHNLLKNNSNGIPFLVIGSTVISGYNEEQTPYKGSAIFLHCFTNNNYSHGCVAIDKDILKSIYQEINKDCHIIIDTKENMTKYYHNGSDNASNFINFGILMIICLVLSL